MFCNPLSDRLAETNFYRFSLRAHTYVRVRMYASHLYEISCFRYDMVPNGSSRAAYETRIYARCDARALARSAGRNSKPRNARPRGRCACLLSWGNELHSRGIADVTCYGTGRTTRRNRSGVRSIFFLLARARRTSVSFCDRHRLVTRRPIVRSTVRLLVNRLSD